MRVVRCLSLTVLPVALAMFGVANLSLAHEGHDHAADQKKAEAKIKEALAKLPAADRALAEAQRYCPIETDDRLGAMGAPIKVMVQGQPVFLCCEECRKDALAKPQETLATVAKFKKASATLAKLPPADRAAAEAQRYCAVQTKNPLGSMGAPIKVMLNGHAAFLCCKGCVEQAQANPKETLANVEKMMKGHGGHSH